MTGSAQVGGLVGAVSPNGTALISSSFSTGNVTGSAQVGGLVGKIYLDWGTAEVTISASLALGDVSGAGDAVGGLIGELSGTATVLNTYASGGGVTTGAMKSISTYTTDLPEAERWSIVAAETGSTVWGVCALANDGYPFLMWQTAGAAPSGAKVTCSPPPVPVIVAPETTPPTTTAPPTTTPPTQPTPVPAVTATGELPQLASGASQVLLNGEPVDVEILVEEETSLVMRGQDFEHRLEAECTGLCNIVTKADGRQALLLEQEGLAEFSGFGFEAG